jgi:hypothetical protein
MNVLKTKTIDFEGKAREYDVVDRNLGVDCPRWFIGYNNGRPFVSDEVPEGFMNYMVFHELQEFEKMPGGEDRCLTTLIEELKRVPEQELKEYVPFRREVFRSLVGYLQRHQQPLESAARKSLEHLERMSI